MKQKYLDTKESVLIEYDTPMVYNSYGEISGFYVCYKKPYECDKTDTVKFWKEIGSRNIDNLDNNATAHILSRYC